MALLPIAVLLALFYFWLTMLVRVHRELRRTGREERAMALTFYTLGVAGVLILLGRRGKSSALAQWVEELTGESPPGRQAAGGRRAEGSGAIELVGSNGKPVRTGRGGDAAEGALVAARSVLQKAVEEEATDVHLEPDVDGLRVRYRIDGMLQVRPSFPPEMSSVIVSALKVMAGMDVAERRRAQDGSFSSNFQGRSVDFRVSTVGTSHGEKMVVRVLDRAVGLRRLQDLGLSESAYRQLHAVVSGAHGMLVVCGPTGSGKTTTLYAALQEVDRAALNVVTIEDPIEYHLENVNQHSVNEKAGITFAGLLRTALRQDPDVLMVGEMRDKETVEIAMQAAMTGHFVYTTTHANDTISALLRLSNFGVAPYLLASSLTCILAQRLVRKVCTSCKRARRPTRAELEQFVKAGFDAQRIKAVYEGAGGCRRCGGTGYKGRIGVFELLQVTDEIRTLMQQSPAITELRKAARRAGLVSLRQDALRKAAKGITTMEEALRVT